MLSVWASFTEKTRIHSRPPYLVYCLTPVLQAQAAIDGARKLTADDGATSAPQGSDGASDRQIARDFPAHLVGGGGASTGRRGCVSR